MKDTINLTALASTLQAYKNCIESKNYVWESRHEDRINEILEALPHGSGLDSGVKLNFEKSTPDKLIFNTSFHHMNDNGYYCGWTEHNLILTPTFGGYNLKITGRNQNFIKEYLTDLFNNIFVCLSEHDTITEQQRKFNNSITPDNGQN